MMLELKEKVFARLNALGFEEVQARRDRGEHLGDPQLVREWLELRGLERFEAGRELQQRAAASASAQTPVASAINARQRR